MGVLISAFTDMTAKDPLLLLVGAVSLVIVLIALYRGYWVVVTHLTLILLLQVLNLMLFVGMVGMVVKFHGAIFGPEQERASAFLWAIILAAALIIGLGLKTGDNVVTRFLKKLTVNGELPE